MNKFRFTIQGLAVVIFTLAFVSLAQAQATRTWVSGVGDDVNPCSRTAPCKTWAGAISKTFINGEIDALDEGGFGTLNITKSITIEGTYGSGFGSTLASGTTGFIINLASNVNDPTKSVRLRNLSINGAGASGAVGTRTGIHGVNILNNVANSNVTIDSCVIAEFSQRGITDARTTGTLQVIDTKIRNTNQGAIVVLGGVTATIDHTRIENCGGTTFAGISIDGAGAKATVSNSQVWGCGFGVYAHNTAAVNLESCTLVNNTTGLFSDNSGGAVVVRISNCNISGNGTGVNNPGGATNLKTYGNNHIDGNTAGNGPFPGSLVNPQ